MKKRTLREIPLRNRPAVPAGTEVSIAFVGASFIKATHTGTGESYNLGFRNAKKNFGSPFTKAPSLATMKRWCSDGIARTVTGERTEPDGYGSDGSPSWLLVMGLI